MIRFLVLIIACAVMSMSTAARDAVVADSLVWHDEFDVDGPPNPAFWSSENGFVRNNEVQWYQPQNSYCHGGLLIIEAREEHKPNPGYNPNGGHWRDRRPEIECTSGSIRSNGKMAYLYGRLEVRARIPALESGSWPAIWLLGEGLPWPSNGEIDVMERYLINGEPHLLANVAWGSDKKAVAHWNTQIRPLRDWLEQDSLWGERFHTWVLDWTPEAITISLDGEILNVTALDKTVNGKAAGEGINPFHYPHHVLLNLAVGTHGDDPDYTRYPIRYEVDYVRLYAPRGSGRVLTTVPGSR